MVYQAYKFKILISAFLLAILLILCYSQVDHIDEGILKFIHLKELILTANYINKIDGRNLPKGLEVI